MAERIYIFKRFERFWHWSQALLIIFMMLTGFEVHGVYSLFGFKAATELHTIAAWNLVSLWVFAIFWHFTKGEWKQYITTLEKVDQMLKFYLTCIFTDAPHPFKQTTVRKHNPLQRLAYLFVLAIINPLIWTTGWFYLFYSSWADWGFGWLSLEWVAFFHVIAAFMMLIFFIAHIYLATAGHTVTSDRKSVV